MEQRPCMTLAMHINCAQLCSLANSAFFCTCTAFVSSNKHFNLIERSRKVLSNNFSKRSLSETPLVAGWGQVDLLEHLIQSTWQRHRVWPASQQGQRHYGASPFVSLSWWFLILAHFCLPTVTQLVLKYENPLAYLLMRSICQGGFHRTCLLKTQLFHIHTAQHLSPVVNSLVLAQVGASLWGDMRK